MYGSDFDRRYEVVAREAGNLSVVDVCCGDCHLARYVGREKYKGIDVNHRFLRFAQKRGHDVASVNVLEDDWPSAECVVIMASLYQFIPQHEIIIEKALRSATQRVIISEPIRNLADSKNPVIAWLARHSAHPGAQPAPYRFNRDTVTELFQKFDATQIIDNGRELVGVFDV